MKLRFILARSLTLHCAEETLNSERAFNVFGWRQSYENTKTKEETAYEE